MCKCKLSGIEDTKDKRHGRWRTQEPTMWPSNFLMPEAI